MALKLASAGVATAAAAAVEAVTKAVFAALDGRAVARAEPGRLAATAAEPGITGDCIVSTLCGSGAPGATLSLSAGAAASLSLTFARVGGMTALKLALRLSKPAGGERDRGRLGSVAAESRLALEESGRSVCESSGGGGAALPILDGGLGAKVSPLLPFEERSVGWPSDL